MNTINLQEKTTAKKGKIGMYWFENEHIGLKRTLFHRLCIPLTPFDSGLEYESQPIETKIVIEWLNLQLANPDNLDGLSIKSTPEGNTEASVYIGYAHNPCDIQKLNFKKIGDNLYELDCELFVNFEYEGVAKNEVFRFNVQAEFNNKVERDN